MAVTVRTLEGTEERVEIRPGTCLDVIIDLGLCSLPPRAFRVLRDGLDVSDRRISECDGALLIIRRAGEEPTRPSIPTRNTNRIAPSATRTPWLVSTLDCLMCWYAGTRRAVMSARQRPVLLLVLLGSALAVHPNWSVLAAFIVLAVGALMWVLRPSFMPPMSSLQRTVGGIAVWCLGHAVAAHWLAWPRAWIKAFVATHR